ncbi:MAG TPA: ABC transporter permease [Anaerolineales bacterium]|nr:ABC transporter permease [Anaerolineales bacterium]
MNAFVQHLSIDFRTSMQNRQLLFLYDLFPLAFYGLMGLVMVQINPLFQETLVPAMVVFAILAATLLGMPDPLVSAREAGIFRSFRVNGVPALNLLVMPFLITILHLVLIMTIITLTANPFFGAPLPVNLPAYLLIFLVMAFASAGIGLLIGVVAPNSRATIIWSQLIFLPSMLLGGLMLPYGILPESVQTFAKLLPSTYAMNAFEGLAYQRPVAFSPEASLAILGVSGILAFGLAIYLFNWDRLNEARRGHPAMALLAFLPYLAGTLLL